MDEIKEAFCRDVDNLDLKPQVGFAYKLYKYNCTRGFRPELDGEHNLE